MDTVGKRLRQGVWESEALVVCIMTWYKVLKELKYNWSQLLNEF